MNLVVVFAYGIRDDGSSSCDSTAIRLQISLQISRVNSAEPTQPRRWVELRGIDDVLWKPGCTRFLKWLLFERSSMPRARAARSSYEKRGSVPKKVLGCLGARASISVALLRVSLASIHKK